MLEGRPFEGNSNSKLNLYSAGSSLPSPQSVCSSWKSDACPLPKYCVLLDDATGPPSSTGSFAPFGCLNTRTMPWRQTVRCVTRTGLTTARTTAPLTKSPGEYWRCGSSGSIWKSIRLRACFFRGFVSLENSDGRVDDAEGCCGSEEVAFAHMSEIPDVVICSLPRARQVVPRTSVTYSPVGCGHAMRNLCGAGLGLGAALYYKRPARSLLRGAVCMRTTEVWFGASRGSEEVHALQVRWRGGGRAVRAESGRQSVRTVWHARGETLHRQGTFDFTTAESGIE